MHQLDSETSWLHNKNTNTERDLDILKRECEKEYFEIRRRENIWKSNKQGIVC